MSLKARIEAVIYAAEEPVTLPQLTALFREEAIASRAARLAPTVDPGQPAEDGLEPELDVTEAVVAELLPPEPDAEASIPAPEALSHFEAGESSTEVPESAPETPSEAVEPDPSAVPSEPAAQNSSDAEVAVPDVEGEPQPFPNMPPEATTPGRENDPGLPPDAQRPDHADAPAVNAIEDAEAPSYFEPEPEAATHPEGANEGEAPSAERLVPERVAPDDEKKAARQREREAREEIRRLIDELIAEYAASDRGLEIREIAGGFRMATRAEYHDAVRAFVRSLKPPMKVSLQALETLAVIAYKQPITAPEIAEVRGVDSGGVLGSLVARKLITTAGRKQVIGRPILYKTTKEFLLRFGLKDLNELPSLEEFEKMASELADQEEPAASQLSLAQNAGDEETEAVEVAEEFTETEPGPEPVDTVLPAGEPEVGAAATEPAETRLETEAESRTDSAEISGPDSSAEEIPEPALAGAETDPEPAPTSEEDVAAGTGHVEGPGDGDPPPPGEDSPVAAHSASETHPASETHLASGEDQS